MSERFFVESPISGDRAALVGDEARHLSKVMRASVGDELVLFDGSGVEYLARIEALGKSAAELTVIERRPTDRELPFELTLAVALPKGERQKWLVEKATELGVTRLVPLITERGVAQPVESALARLRRTVIEASKQCGRNRLMDICDAEQASPWFAKGRERRSESRGQGLVGWSHVSCHRLIADPSGKPLSTIERDAVNVIAAVGPEGGFAPDELAAAVKVGWQPVSLGKTILRVETAAVAVAAWAALR